MKKKIILILLFTHICTLGFAQLRAKRDSLINLLKTLIYLKNKAIALNLIS